MKLICALGLFFLSTSQVLGNTPHIFKHFKTSIDLYGFEPRHQAKLTEALELSERVIKSEEFSHSILKFEYQEKKQFADNSSHSNLQVLSFIAIGAEILEKVSDKEMNLEVEHWIPRFPTSTTGYTSRGVRRIWINGNYLERASVPELAGTLVHEWMHKIGYEHDKKLTAKRPYSVPYGVGEIVVKIGNKLLNQEHHSSVEAGCFEKLSNEELSHFP